MVHTFLPGMIERKRGRIVSISSITAINTIPSAVVYSATKWGVDGFMSCLYDELSLYDLDEYIKLTTVYPDFTNTRKELAETLDQIKHIIPRLSPTRVADETVRGMLANKRQIYVSDITLAHLMLR